VARKYELKRRAERQEQTRLRIVEAAIELHRTKGPARTTLSDIARVAGVERHTLYRHFPDERAIGLACSALHVGRNPPPDAAQLLSIEDLNERRRAGLTELYTWFEANQDMLGAVLRDAEVDPLAGEMFALRAGEAMGKIGVVLAEGLEPGGRGRAVLELALDFYTWRRLARSGLSVEDAAGTMAGLMHCP